MWSGFFSPKIQSDNDLDYIGTCSNFIGTYFMASQALAFSFKKEMLINFVWFFFGVFFTKLYFQFPILTSTVWPFQYCMTRRWSTTFKIKKKRCRLLLFHILWNIFQNKKIKAITIAFISIYQGSAMQSKWHYENFKPLPKRYKKHLWPSKAEEEEK